jgi:hypothetical protein
MSFPPGGGIMRFKNVDFDLLYLGLLTSERIKPLSRWEGEFGRTEIEALKSLGLKAKSVKRPLESGGTSEELIFSKDRKLIGEYEYAFERKPISYSRECTLLEGKLFGYPECCARSFASHGYLPNDLSEDDQQILFHWACPECKVTPRLLPDYRIAYKEAKGIQEAHVLAKHGNPGVAGVVPALGLVSCLLLAGCSHKSTCSEGKPDIHWMSVEQDADQDYLQDQWEQHFSLNPDSRDTDHNGVPDGPQLATSMWNTIQNHPDCVEVNYREMFGLYTCSKCGKTVNMGYLEIINPQKEKSICVGFLALHFMEHGSFAYEGEEGVSGLVNPVELDSVLSE